MKPSDVTYPEAAAALRQQEIIPGFAALRQPTLLPACSLSKLRSSLEVGKKMLRVWLQYVCSVPYGESEIARNEFEDGSKWYVKGNACSSVNEVDFVRPRTFVLGLMNIGSFFGQ